MPENSLRRAVAGCHYWLATLLVLWMTWAAVALADAPVPSPSAAGRLQVLPSELVVSADHPARLVVVQQLPDGTQQDVTDQAKLTIEDASIAQCDANHTLHAAAVGETRLLATWKDLHADAPLHVTDVGLAEPRFPIEVSAVLSKAGCNLGTCHGNLHGKAGFRLSLRGDDPRLDYDSITRGAGGRRIDWFAPRQSLLLRKPSGDIAHQGGLRLPADSPGYDVLHRWLAAGAPWASAERAGDASSTAGATAADRAATPGAVRVSSLHVYPDEAWLPPAARRQQLVVVAQLADGSRRDVTRWTRFEASVLEGVSVSEDGNVAAERPVDVTVSAHYLDAQAQSRLVFLQRNNLSADAPQPSGQPIDRLVDQRLQRMRIEPAPLAAPEVFLRRLFIVVAGRLPTAEETCAFLADSVQQRRQRWVARAVTDPGYADLWALHLSDLLRNEPKTMSLEGATRWNAWLAEGFRNDRPLDAIVRDLLATVGSTYDRPPASFHRTHREPTVAAEAVGQVFLGIRMQCAQCHNHPFDVWKQDDYYGLAAYFTTLRRKQIDNAPRDKLDSHVITGDEIISLAEGPPRIRHPGLSIDVPPKPLDQPQWDADAAAADHPLQQLADWLTRDNRFFARNMANRIWYHVMGRGIVDPPDDFRGSNPPSNPELLEYLTDRLIASGFSTQAVVREILASDTFARQSVSQSTSPETLDGAAAFAGYPLRRMSAEVLLDAISDVTGVPVQHEIPGHSPRVERAVRFPAAPQEGFLKSFGKPDRLLSCECERSGDASLSQSLLLINGPDVRDRIAARPNRIDRLLDHSGDPQDWIGAMYLSALTRLPTADELRTMSAHAAQAVSDREAAEDILWALINSQEFYWIR